jgi:SAM-dependent methyltransferase
MISKVRPVVKDTGDNSGWFQSWFDSPYYHVLYKNHDEDEAENFLEKLIGKVGINKEARVLDVGCGRGRHSIYLNKEGFDVTGIDLSPSNILFDKQFENEKLNFYLHDMREVFRSNYYDLVLNLFSSFGYFDKERDNLRCIIAIAMSLKPGGIFVFDYLNAEKVRLSMEEKNTKDVDGIHFRIHKYVDGNFIRKDISFNTGDKVNEYREQLALYDRKTIENFFRQSGLTVSAAFGNYNFDSFDSAGSDRIILIAQKIKS